MTLQVLIKYIIQTSIETIYKILLLDSQKLYLYACVDIFNDNIPWCYQLPILLTFYSFLLTLSLLHPSTNLNIFTSTYYIDSHDLFL